MGVVGRLEKRKQFCSKCIDTTMACLGFKLSNMWKQKKAMKSGADFEEYVDWTWSYNLIKDANNEDKFGLMQKGEDEEENNYDAVYDTFSIMRSDSVPNTVRISGLWSGSGLFESLQSGKGLVFV